MIETRRTCTLRQRGTTFLWLGLGLVLCSCLRGGFLKGMAGEDEPNALPDAGEPDAVGDDAVENGGEEGALAAAEDSDSSSHAADGGAEEPAPTPPAAPGDWILVRAGSFTMGSPEAEVGRLADEGEHRVTLTHDVWMLRTEITQAQFQRVMGYNPAHYGPDGTGPDCGPNCPVESMSWHELAAYGNELSRTEGLAECYACTGEAPEYECRPREGDAPPSECPGYRLPTEAEWEYAARAGDERATYNGDLAVIDCVSSQALDSIAWHCGNSLATTHPVEQKEPNQWDLYDMLGNVYEWCHDWYGAYPEGSATNPGGASSGTERVVRGGSCLGHARWARAAHRDSSSPDLRAWAVGGRVVRSQP